MISGVAHVASIHCGYSALIDMYSTNLSSLPLMTTLPHCVDVNSYYPFPASPVVAIAACGLGTPFKVGGKRGSGMGFCFSD